MLKIEELKNLNLKELDEELTKATKGLFKIRFEVNTGSSKASIQVRRLRKYRAQILTMKNQLNKEEQAKLDDQKSIKNTETVKE